MIESGVAVNMIEEVLNEKRKPEDDDIIVPVLMFLLMWGAFLVAIWYRLRMIELVQARWMMKIYRKNCKAII